MAEDRLCTKAVDRKKLQIIKIPSSYLWTGRFVAMKGHISVCKCEQNRADGILKRRMCYSDCTDVMVMMAVDMLQKLMLDDVLRQ